MTLHKFGEQIKNHWEAGVQCQAVLDRHRQVIGQLGSSKRTKCPALPFGLDSMDRVLPNGGLVADGLHEIAGGESGAVHGAAAILFAALQRAPAAKPSGG